MGLKLRKFPSCLTRTRILIAPMWDWNDFIKSSISFWIFNSNCTNVGLKSKSKPTPPVLITILIAPMWDWNQVKPTHLFRIRDHSNCTNVGLKFSRLIKPRATRRYSNCTNVGLKFRCAIDESILFAIILIAPMWDWNKRSSAAKYSRRAYSNCTNVGLKCYSIRTSSQA